MPASGSAEDDPDATVVRPRAGSTITRTQALPPRAHLGPDPSLDPDATVVKPRTAPVDPDATVILRPGAAPAVRLPEPRQLPLALALAPGFRLHEYRIERVLGQGGFGITYLATDVHLNSQVAIKEYLPEEIAFRTGDRSISPNATQHRDRYREGLESFLVEARTLATFRHPAIVRVARFFEAHRTAYMVLEYEQGQPFKTWWPENRHLGEAGLIELLLPLLDGLAAVHEAGFLHRDIKPDNIQVRAADGRLVLLDFGSAGQTVAVAGQGAVVVTPGYAPLEQYGFGRQGAWTDLYALGATLYWAVTGRKPPDAELRMANPRSHTPALEAGAAAAGGVVYGQAFLQAIDWALTVEVAERPQSVAALRRALCTDHVASLDLQEALRDGDTQPDEAHRPLRERLRTRLRRFFDTLLHPPSWPLALKMTLAMVATALLPMGVTAVYNLRAAQDALTAGELRFVEQIALSSAGRISQFITDHRHLARVLASEGELLQAVASAPAASASAPAAPAVDEKFGRFVRANPDLERVWLADARGLVRASSDAALLGADVAQAAWFREAVQGRAHTGDLALGRDETLPGMVLAQPVAAADGTVAGVLALRVRGSSLVTIVDEVRNDASLTPFLLDRDGVVLHHLQEDLVYRSLVPLPPERQAALAAEQRFRRERIESLDETALAAAVLGAQRTGHVAYRSAVHGREEIAGYAPVAAHDWVVGVAKSRTDFEAPLQPLNTQLLWSVLLVGLLFTGLALRFARSIVRPVRALTQAAAALKEGQYEAAGVEVKRRDELGQLGRTFNVMIDVLRQRDRERRREGG
ncbi:serine/threonine protein kinase [Rubrivivax rivuli]|uniref:HAMP domain-containing protein n=1 Tax=Rubrivivax rivuli TaxID=1862385 RepID=A0A437RCI0_9BURK|nr:cache domain-containing protein [Rubrivivax rivuli]RVU44472.1 HAMP domain-containing protein [Rubrivivax rivuli]